MHPHPQLYRKHCLADPSRSPVTHFAVLMAAILGFLLATLPSATLAYSDEYCTSLNNATADSIRAHDWHQLLKVSMDREQNCSRYQTVNEQADSINTQATAYYELGRPKDALDTARRCLRISDIPDCHISKGRALIKLSRGREGNEELKVGLKLAQREISRLGVELRQATSASDRQALEARLYLYDSLSNFARAILGESSPQPARAEAKRNSPSSGSGMRLNSGDVLTNYHVVDGCKAISTVDSVNKKSSATVIAADQSSDLAVVRTQPSDGDVAVFRSETTLQVGEAVTVVGFPLAGLLASGANVTFGNISALAGLRDDKTKLQISAPVQPGNSGGPLLDRSGLVIGVVVQKLDAVKVAKLIGDIPQNINFAINGEVAKSFLASNRVRFSTAAPATALEGTEIARLGKAMTVLLKCER
ncbi:MAG: trypsin-like peptidase domain-containing protein [Proteobacteria bacterium]|nr:trypsin-like peptidase domain-containing protein [Pseudomonadota bacterium]